MTWRFDHERSQTQRQVRAWIWRSRIKAVRIPSRSNDAPLSEEKRLHARGTGRLAQEADAKVRHFDTV